MDVNAKSSSFVAREVIPGLSREELTAATGAPLIFAPDCGDLLAPELPAD